MCKITLLQTVSEPFTFHAVDVRCCKNVYFTRSHGFKPKLDYFDFLWIHCPTSRTKKWTHINVKIFVVGFRFSCEIVVQLVAWICCRLSTWRWFVLHASCCKLLHNMLYSESTTSRSKWSGRKNTIHFVVRSKWGLLCKHHYHRQRYSYVTLYVIMTSSHCVTMTSL